MVPRVVAYIYGLWSLWLAAHWQPLSDCQSCKQWKSFSFLKPINKYHFCSSITVTASNSLSKIHWIVFSYMNCSSSLFSYLLRSQYEQKYTISQLMRETVWKIIGFCNLRSPETNNKISFHMEHDFDDMIYFQSSIQYQNVTVKSFMTYVHHLDYPSSFFLHNFDEFRQNSMQYAPFTYSKKPLLIFCTLSSLRSLRNYSY